LNDVRRELKQIGRRLTLTRAMRDEAYRLSDVAAGDSLGQQVEQLTANYKAASKKGQPVRLLTDLELLSQLRTGARAAEERGRYFEAADLQGRADERLPSNLHTKFHLQSDARESVARVIMHDNVMVLTPVE
jgi:hypothetical protein